MPPLSRRIAATDEPIIATMRALAGRPGTVSLAQGAVHWAPPEAALNAARDTIGEPATSAYSDDLGTPALRAALRAMLAVELGLPVVGEGGEPAHPWAYDVAVTAGANQAVAALALILTDPAPTAGVATVVAGGGGGGGGGGGAGVAAQVAGGGGGVAILFSPFYFNSRMALQLAGAAVEVGPCDGQGIPDAAWLEVRLAQAAAGTAPPVAMVYAVTPGNPTGMTLGPAALAELVSLTAAACAWLVLDVTYEAFTVAEPASALPAAQHLLYVGSFSKAYGLAGWRVGWVAFPEDGRGDLAGALLKVNDTIPIHAAVASQAVAAACLGAPGCGRAWVRARVAGLAPSRAASRASLDPLIAAGGSVTGGDAIYWWATLPPGCEDDGAVVRWLVAKHGVAVVPGSACGAPGRVRVAFGKPAPGPDFEAAAARLRAGCDDLVSGGMAGVRAWLEAKEGAGGEDGERAAG